MDRKLVAASVVAAFAIGAVCGGGFFPGESARSMAPNQEQVLIPNSDRLGGVTSPADRPADSAQERKAVEASVSPEPERQGGEGNSTLTEATPRGAFHEVSFYEASTEFNPARRVLTKDERQWLETQLDSLAQQVALAEARAMSEAQTAITRLREAGKTRPVVAGDDVKLGFGAVCTGVSVDQNGTTAVDVYPQDAPNAVLLQEEANALRNEGLALVRSFFQHQ